MLGQAEQGGIEQYQAVAIRAQVYRVGAQPQAAGMILAVQQPGHGGHGDIPLRVRIQSQQAA